MLEEVWRRVRSFFFTLFSSVSAGSFQCAIQQQKRKKNEQTSTFCRWYLGIFLPVFTVHPCDPRYRRPSSFASPLFNSASRADSTQRQARRRSTHHFLCGPSQYSTRQRVNDRATRRRARDCSGSFLSSEGSFDCDISRPAVSRQIRRERLRLCVFRAVFTGLHNLRRTHTPTGWLAARIKPVKTHRSCTHRGWLNVKLSYGWPEKD